MFGGWGPAWTAGSHGRFWRAPAPNDPNNPLSQSLVPPHRRRRLHHLGLVLLILHARLLLHLAMHVHLRHLIHLLVLHPRHHRRQLPLALPHCPLEPLDRRRLLGLLRLRLAKVGLRPLHPFLLSSILHEAPQFYLPGRDLRLGPGLGRPEGGAGIQEPFELSPRRLHLCRFLQRRRPLPGYQWGRGWQRWAMGLGFRAWAWAWAWRGGLWGAGPARPSAPLPHACPPPGFAQSAPGSLRSVAQEHSSGVLGNCSSGVLATV